MGVTEVTGHLEDRTVVVDRAFEDAIVVVEEVATLSHCFRCTDSKMLHSFEKQSGFGVDRELDCCCCLTGKSRSLEEVRKKKEKKVCLH